MKPGEQIVANMDMKMFAMLNDRASAYYQRNFDQLDPTHAYFLYRQFMVGLTAVKLMDTQQDLSRAEIIEKAGETVEQFLPTIFVEPIDFVLNVSRPRHGNRRPKTQRKLRFSLPAGIIDLFALDAELGLGQ
ncbi:MAG: hypothetical protein ACREGC_02925 [Minisyncoccia bacterium]